jgi:hypothetical protein
MERLSASRVDVQQRAGRFQMISHSLYDYLLVLLVVPAVAFMVWVFMNLTQQIGLTRQIGRGHRRR